MIVIGKKNLTKIQLVTNYEIIRVSENKKVWIIR